MRNSRECVRDTLLQFRAEAPCAVGGTSLSEAMMAAPRARYGDSLSSGMTFLRNLVASSFMTFSTSCRGSVRPRRLM